MIRIAAAGIFGALAFAGLAQATEMRPMQATSISLGGVTGIAYYSEVKGSFEIVATLAAGEAATPVRFVTTLVDGQKMLISVPQAAGKAPIELEFARLGDRLSVSEMPTVAAMAN
jgi:hypothetical protein